MSRKDVVLTGCLPNAKSSRGDRVRVLCDKLSLAGNEEQRQPGSHGEVSRALTKAGMLR